MSDESKDKEVPEQPIKPVLIVEKGTMSADDIERLRANGLCAVEATSPQSIRFMEPVPLSYTAQQAAAIELSRVLISEGVKIDGQVRRQLFATMFADILMRADPLRSRT